MQLTMHPYQNDEDYWRIREFLRGVLRLNGMRQRCWDVARFDYWRWHPVENIFHLPLEEVLFIWETGDGRIAGILCPDSPGEAFLQVHPTLRTPDLENEMLSVAEQHLAALDGDRRRILRVWVNENNRSLQGLVENCGYHPCNRPEYQRRRSMDLPIAEAPLAPGFTVRTLGDVEELPLRSLVSWKAFHPGEPDDNYRGWMWYHNIQRSPLYRRDLDLVAAAPTGEFASFCTIWFDDVTRSGVFEPVGTDPAYQRRGLARAVMTEGLQRLKRLGAKIAYVGSYTEGAGALYASMGFKDYELSVPWEKTF